MNFDGEYRADDMLNIQTIKNLFLFSKRFWNGLHSQKGHKLVLKNVTVEYSIVTESPIHTWSYTNDYYCIQSRKYCK